VLALAGNAAGRSLGAVLRDGSSCGVQRRQGRLVLKLPEPQPEEVDRVIVLELEAQSKVRFHLR